MSDPPPRPRPAARVLLVDELHNLLLVRFESQGRRWWAAPGGALKSGETHEQAAVREVREETGLDGFELGPWVWTRSHVWTDSEGASFEQLERFFLAHVVGFTAQATDLEAHEASAFRGLRWWTLDQLEASDEELSPRLLAQLVRQLLEDGPPAHPFEVGI